METSIWLDATYLLTSIIAIFDLIFSVYIMYLVLSSRVFHTNLRILMTGITISSCLMFIAVICTVVMAIGDADYQQLRLFALPSPFDKFFLIFLWGGFSFAFLSMALFLERIYASFHLRAYEYQTYFMAMISCDIFIFTGTFGLAVCMVNLWIPIVISAIILSFIMLHFVVLYGCLFRAHLWNKQRFFRSKIHIRTYTLSQRFQLSENVRTVSLILNSALYAAVGGGITASQIFLMFVFSKNMQFLLPILNVTQPLGISLIFLPAAVSQILVIPAWKQRTIQLLNSLTKIRGVGKVVDTVANNKGVEMDVFIVKQRLDKRRLHDQELYFEMFKSAWQ